MVQPGPDEGTGLDEYRSRILGALDGAMAMDDDVVMAVLSLVVAAVEPGPGPGLGLGPEPEPEPEPELEPELALALVELAVVVGPAVAEQPRFVVAAFAVAAVMPLPAVKTLACRHHSSAFALEPEPVQVGAVADDWVERRRYRVVGSLGAVPDALVVVVASDQMDIGVVDARGTGVIVDDLV